jgi:regulator of cell morphogenesis and NO signaling
MQLQDKHATVGSIVAARPAAARVFERHGIDYCCGGSSQLQQVCDDKQLDIDEIVQEIDDQTLPPGTPDWASMDLATMCNEIERRWHRPLDTELPRLETLSQKVARVHGNNRPALRELADLYATLKSELTVHMMKEEQVLFPMIRARGSAPPPPIGVMRHEHDNAGALLRAMRASTDQYTLPESACASYRALFSGLVELERSLHAHIHVENNVLFPRALQ